MISSFQVVDRTNLKSLIKEHKLSSTGLIDPGTAKQLGKIAGVEALITGTLTPFGDSVRLAAKVLNTETANVITAERGNIAKTQAIAYLLSQGLDAGQGFGSQQAIPGAAYSPQSSLGVQTKRVGDLTITLKKIQILRGKIIVVLDLFNHLKNSLLISRDSRDPIPNLSDEKGNVFKYKSGIASGYHRDWQVLNPESNNDLVLHFETTDDMTIKDIGSNFTVTFFYLLYDTKKKGDDKKFQVSFLNFPAYKPQ